MLARLGEWTGRLIAGLAFGLLVVGMAVGPIPALAQTRSATLSGIITGHLANGSTDCTAPSLGWAAQTNTGFAREGTNSILVCIGGLRQANWSGTAYRNAADEVIGWTASVGNAATTLDLVMQRIATGVIQFGNAVSPTGFTRVVFGPNDGTANGWSLLRSGSYIETWSGDGTSARTGIKTSGILNVGAFQSVNNIGTAGNYGVPAIQAAGSGAAISAAADTNRCTVTPAADGDFEISDNILVTTAGSLAATAVVAYTDEGSTARTQTIPFVLVAGTAIVTALAAANGTVPYSGIPLHIRAKSGVAINVSTTGTFTGSVYNHRCIIRALQ